MPESKLTLFKEERKILERFSNDAKWFNDNWDAIRKRYSGDFVAVKEKKVIAHDEDLAKLIDKLKKMGEKPANLVIETTYRPKGDIILALPQEPWKRELLLDIRQQGESELKEMVTGSPGKWEFTEAGKKYLLEGKPLASSKRR